MNNLITWLHISDIHFHANSEWQAAPARAALLKYLGELFDNDESLYPELIFCTGDIAFGETGSSSLSEQYKQAECFFDELLVTCSRNGAPLTKERLFLVPGNHDINRRTINGDAQDSLILKSKVSREHIGKINQRFESFSIEVKEAMTRLDEYSSFISEYLPEQHDNDGRNNYTRIVDINGLKIGIAGFNSAWSCSGLEDDRHLWLAAKWQFNNAKTALESTDLRIGLIHHPEDWFNEAERDIVVRRVSADFDFWLHGHSHNAWVEDKKSHITIAAGAVGADHSDEFGINITKLSLADKTGIISLHGFSPRDNDWIIQPIPKNAPRGEWGVELPSYFKDRLEKNDKPCIDPNQCLSTATELPQRKLKIFGRDKWIEKSKQLLLKDLSLLVYGLRGNGKSSVIEALGNEAPLNNKEMLRFQITRHMSVKDVFRQFSSLLEDNSEDPQPPEGSVDEIASELLKSYPNPREAWIWIDRAHQLISNDNFRDKKLRNLLLGMKKAFGKKWSWIFELRERPSKGVFGENFIEVEVTGLDKSSLAELIVSEAPVQNQSDWNYKGNDLKRIYQWLGGGHGNQAHPLAARLMIEVALGLKMPPMQILLRHVGDFELKVEDVLLNDLFTNVLNTEEQKLLQAISLYRKAVPHDHIDELEDSFKVKDAFYGLERRCLISVSADHERYYLHGFILMWLRHGMGYCTRDDEDPELTDILNTKQRNNVQVMQTIIGNCWLSQLRSNRKSRLNIERALEAFYHLTEGGDAKDLQKISVELLGGNFEWAKERISSLTYFLFKNKAPIAKQIEALEYAMVLDPADHKALRFLGECWRKKDGPKSDKALACFEKTWALKPTFSPHLANLGKALLARGEDGARNFLKQFVEIEKSSPRVLDDHVIAIQCNCLEKLNKKDEARSIRLNHIALKSTNAAFYADEANSLLALDKSNEALIILDLADKNGCGNDYLVSIRTLIIKKAGDSEAASTMRQSRIKAGSSNSAFYADEANFLLDINDKKGAIEVLDSAVRNGCDNDFILSIRATALDRLGKYEEAEIIRMEKISTGSSVSVFYNDMANILISKNDVQGAIDILDLAVKNLAVDAYSYSLRSKANKMIS